MVVIKMVNADSETSSLNFAAIRRESTIVGMPPSIKHAARVSPDRPRSFAEIKAIKGTTASLIITAGMII